MLPEHYSRREHGHYELSSLAPFDMRARLWLTANPLRWSILCAAALALGAFGNGPMVFIAYGVMVAALLALSKAAKDQGIEAAEMAAEDPAWRAHMRTLRTLPFSAVHAREEWRRSDTAFCRQKQT